MRTDIIRVRVRSPSRSSAERHARFFTFSINDNESSMKKSDTTQSDYTALVENGHPLEESQPGRVKDELRKMNSCGRKQGMIHK